MKRTYISLLLIVCALSLSAQNLWLGAEGQKFYDELILRKAARGEVESYEGSPYMDEEFTEATIVSSENQVFNKVPLRYNVYYDLFEVQLDEGVFNLKRGGVVAKVSLQGHDFVYTTYDYQSTEGEGYLELIIEGRYKLYKQHQIVFKEAEPAQPYQEAKPAMFQERDPLFYIAFNDNRPVFIKNKSNLMEIAGDNEKALKDFIKDNRIKIRDEEDIVKVVEYLNYE
ncbi:MAG: hypothetical protein JW965_04955 [Bacteroidales bacterium]|nr:hypothetical protein [Bacteroidales bacterium]